MKKKQSSPVSQTKIWIVTIVAVIAIVGLAIVLSTMGKARRDAPSVPAIAVVAQPEPEEAPQEIVRQAPPAAATGGGVASLVPVEKAKPAPVDRRPALQLDKLAGTLKVTSAGINPTGRVNLDYTCYRRGQSMPVMWSGVPSSAKSIVLVMEELKPGESPFAKWVVYNVPPENNGLPAGLPQAEAFEGGIRQGQTDHGGVGYTGPCVPRGTINYKLRLFALDTVLDVTTPQKFEALIPLMNGHIVDATELEFFHYLKM